MTTHPARLQRSRKKGARTTPGAVYVGRPTLWSNPFGNRPRIGHKRSVILYSAWLRSDLTPFILTRAGFSADEIAALARWRTKLLSKLPSLSGRNLECWCPLTSAWCHAEALIRAANGERP